MKLQQQPVCQYLEFIFIFVRSMVRQWFDQLVRPSVDGEKLMRTLCFPALPLKLFLNRNDEWIKAKSGPSRGEKWKAEFDLPLLTV